MKKSFVFLCVSCLVLLSGSYLMAGGVDNRSNYSGEYVRTLDRNAATDSIDAIAYNPAGVMMMQDGTYGNFSLHYVTKDYTNTVDGVELKQDKGSFVPALFALYKKDNWAGFFSFTIPAGGGEVEYKNGDATTMIGATKLRNLLNQKAEAAIYGDIADEELNARSFYYGFTLGGAYKVNDIISLSLAGRYINADKKAVATFQLLPTDLGTLVGQPDRVAVLDYKDEADGWGLILGMGIDLNPFYIGMKYETETSLDFKYNVKQDSITGLPAGLGASQGIINGRKHARNLPALFSFGLAYTVNQRVKVDAGLIYYFQKNADWDGAENNVDNGWETSITLEYKFDDNLKGTVGYLHTITGMDARYALKEAPELNAESFGCGIVYKYSEKLKMNFGAALVSYHSDSYTDTSSGTAMLITLDKAVKMFSAGAEYRF